MLVAACLQVYLQTKPFAGCVFQVLHAGGGSSREELENIGLKRSSNSLERLGVLPKYPNAKGEAARGKPTALPLRRGARGACSAWRVCQCHCAWCASLHYACRHARIVSPTQRGTARHSIMRVCVWSCWYDTRCARTHTTMM